MQFLTIILLLFAVAAAAPVVVRFTRDWSGWLLALFPAGLFVWGITRLPDVAAAPLLERVAWIPSLGVSLSFRFDGLSALFFLLITGIGALVVIYAGGYLKGAPRLGRFHAFLFLFMAAMLGLVLSDNLIALFVFWELTSITSFLLIGYNHESVESRRSALQALLVTGAGGLALLAGLILIAAAAGGTFEFSELLQRAEQVHASPLYTPALFLVLLGAFTKSAQAPFHFWLPGAMAAPAPVSAYLHSATMVKAGVYLLARMTPLLGGSAEWHYLVTFAGAATMLVGALMAFAQTDLKRLLAYSTVSALGMLVLLIGIGTDLAAKAMLVFLVVHSLYKGALFMVAGSVDHEAGTRDVRRLGGLLRVLPFTGAAAILAALSMTGFPPLLGFIGKELMYEAKLQAPAAALLLLASGVLANAANIAVALIVGIRPFLAARERRPAGVHEGGIAFWIGPLLMGSMGLLFGLFPDVLGEVLIEPAAAAVRATQLDVDLALWHGVNLVFLLSVFTVVLGVLLFALRRLARRFAGRVRWPALLTPTGLYHGAVGSLPGAAAATTRLMQNGSLRSYLVTVIVAVLILLARALLSLPAFPVEWTLEGVALYEYGLVLLIIAATVLVLVARTRLVAVAGLGVIGFGVSLIFIFYSAPDLAITQILVETLTVIIFVLVVARLPQLRKRSSFFTRLRDGTIALASGAVVTALALLAAEVQFRPSISGFFAENSLAQGFGRNVVNVILVDFRALDTLGEITVIAVAAFGVYALLKLRRTEDEIPDDLSASDEGKEEST
ncbi:MAG: putative monovalent cation/H+ antiporter subunit A [Bacteroidetes bacterium]|nr:putative monovalent cation/H+ antiporter subunit A [Bacteroidota bacterium]